MLICGRGPDLVVGDVVVVMVAEFGRGLDVDLRPPAFLTYRPVCFHMFRLLPPFIRSQVGSSVS